MSAGCQSVTGTFFTCTFERICLTSLLIGCVHNTVKRVQENRKIVFYRLTLLHVILFYGFI
nr:MAG TPA: hypothetical protein [Caudoviricetes sp.]